MLKRLSNDLWAKMHILDRLKTGEAKDESSASLSARPFIQLVDVIAIAIVLIGVVWGIVQRRHLPAVPLWTLDTWGYLSPALSWLTGQGFEQTNGRDWLYPAIVFATMKSSGDFGWIVRLQQCLSLLAAPLLWCGVRLWLSIFARRSDLCHAAGVLLGAIGAFVYVLGTTQILHELSIGPEGVLSFFVILSLICALAYFSARWVTHKPWVATLFGAGALVLSYADILLKPSWSLAFIPVCCLLVVGIFGSGSRTLRFAPAAAGFVLLAGTWALPLLLQFKRDLGSRTFLPLTLVSIHAAQIVQNAERHHLLEGGQSRPDNMEMRFYLALQQAYNESQVQPLTARTLGFDADYIMYRGKFFSKFQSEENLSDDGLIKLCYAAYFAVWRESPDLMMAKIAKECRLFLSAPRQDFAAYTLSKDWFLQVAAGSVGSVDASMAEAKSRGYLNLPFYAGYLRNLEKVYAEGLQIHRVNVQQRYLALLVAKLSLWIQIAFFVALLCCFLNRRFCDLRLPGWAAVFVAAVLYGNVLTISIVHTLDLDRYRTSYAPVLLVTLVIMTVFVLGWFERLFRVLAWSPTRYN